MTTITRKESPLERLYAKVKAQTPAMEKGFVLAIGAKEQLQAKYPDMPPELIVAIIKRHVSTPEYITAVARGSFRCNLDGSRAGKLKYGHKCHASKQLKKLEAEDAKSQDETPAIKSPFTRAAGVR